MGSPAGISSSMDAAASISASRSSSIRRWRVICWAQYAPPISDYFRKSYRKLLRWNDEFPFAKFSVSEDERPVLAVEVPIADADADALGLASRASWASPTRSSTSRRTGSGSAAGCPTRVIAPRPTPRSSTGSPAGSRSSSGREAS